MDKIEKKGPVRILKEHLMSNSNQYWSIIVCTKFLGKKILHVNFLQQPHSMMVSEEIYLINIESYDNSKKKKKNCWQCSPKFSTTIPLCTSGENITKAKKYRPDYD
jgi:hypothetical protein